MVWGTMSFNVKSSLWLSIKKLNFVKCRDEILLPYVVHFTRIHGLTSQNDNTKPHVAAVCITSLTHINVQTTEVPHIVQI